MQKLKAVIYTRYSTNSQTSNSTEYQLRSCEEFCAQNGYEVVDTYIDEGFSGGTADRPAFQHLLRDAEAPHSWSAVVVYNLSRFSRESTAEIYEQKLTDRGIVLLSTKEPNESSPSGRYLRRNAYINNAYYRENAAVHTIDGMLNKAVKGIHCGGIPPLGYIVDHEQKLAIKEEEAEVVRSIFRMYDANMSYTQMAKLLNEEGHRTKSGRRFTKNSFANILKQEKYIGVLKWNVRQSKNSDGSRNNSAHKPSEQQVILEHGCPPIVPDDLFERVQQKLKRGKNSASSCKSRYPYLLSGRDILYCAECGSKMVGTRHHSRGKIYTTYYCPHHKNGDCSTKEIPAKLLDNFVVSKVVENVVVMKDALQLTKSLSQTASTASLKAKLRAVETSITNVLLLIEQDPLNSLLTRLKELDAQKTQLTKAVELSQLPTLDITERNIRQIRRQLLRYMLTKQDPDVYFLLKAVVQKIEVGNDKINVSLSA